MATLFLICAVAGGTLFVCQFVMLLLGVGHHDMHFDHHHDLGHGDGASVIWGVLSARAIVVGVTFFGLAGMAAQEAKLAAALTVPIATAVGFVGALAVAWLMRSVLKLEDDGTTRIERAKGATGTVYISIPAENKGPGKVQLEMQNRIVELAAVTPKSALETGTKVVVVDVVDPDTVEVIAVPQRS
jgi:hypothetical protein